uniref:No apical meristem-associated C-terminal domain-containing protein n=1 Tax=Lactuca sativa TaxID=4236 RepID=A0A9R1UXE2_LACSA|nr:hypothetical protein LSAT_V11C700344000 [Lactuca sativa]
MDPNQNTPPNYRNRKPDNAFALDTTPRQFPTMESPQGGFINLLQTGSPIQQTPLNATFTTTSTKKEKRKKKPVRPNTAQERILWKKEEEEKLVEACVAASENPIVGDNAPKWKEQTEGTSQSSGSKRSRNPNATSQQSDGRTHIGINDDPLDFENDQPLRRSVGRNKAKKSASTSSNSSVMDMFDDKFDRYVQLQETKVEVMTRIEQKMIEAQTSFQEAQAMIQTKTDMKILKMKADDLEGKYLELFQAIKESVRARRRCMR